MGTKIIGREAEISTLKDLLQSKSPELLAIYGRRRIGKTFLIRTFFREQIAFSCTGQYKSNLKEQLVSFSENLHNYFPDLKWKALNNWQQAFVQLRNGLRSLKTTQKQVVFFDELPWLSSRKSGFLPAFSYFWNVYASDMPNIIVVICGSAASWIIDKVVNDKGGLHNRITKRIRLLPFTLKETKEYLEYKNIRYGHYELLQLYMIMGGIPAYLNEVKRGKSVAQNIENICFSKDGLLAGEFNNLYAALFVASENHVQVIRALAKKNKGLTRVEIVSASGLMTGGTLTRVLSELTQSGFIEKVYPIGKKEKDSLYILADEFSLFYFRFMRQHSTFEQEQWLSLQSSASYKSWCGYAFENVCIKHIAQIKQALQIGGLYSRSSSWIFKGDKSRGGTQIDLLIERADHIINICEIKYSSKPFIINKRYSNELQEKLRVFSHESGTRKSTLLTFISTYGIVDNDYKYQLVDSEVTMADLFR